MKQKIAVLSLSALLAAVPLTNGVTFANTGSGNEVSVTSAVYDSSERDSSESQQTPDRGENMEGKDSSKKRDAGNDSSPGKESGSDENWSDSWLEKGIGGLIPGIADGSDDNALDGSKDVAELLSNLREFRSKIAPEEFQAYAAVQAELSGLFRGRSEVDVEKIAELEQTLEANPGNKRLYVELAMAYAVSGDLSKAQQIADKLAALAPASDLALILQAELAVNQEEKQLYLEQAVKNNPTNAVARVKFGERLAQAGNYQEATAQLLVASALNPKDEQVFEQLNNVYAKAGDKEIKAFVNGVVPNFDVKPFVEEGRTLVPFRAISEALGAQVGWDAATKQVSIESNGAQIRLTINEKVAIVNGKRVVLDVPAKAIDGRLVIPLRFVSEALGTAVDWKAEGKMIVISE